MADKQEPPTLASFISFLILGMLALVVIFFIIAFDATGSTKNVSYICATVTACTLFLGVIKLVK